jgi:hypothetical protein
MGADDENQARSLGVSVSGDKSFLNRLIFIKSALKRKSNKITPDSDERTRFYSYSSKIIQNCFFDSRKGYLVLFCSLRELSCSKHHTCLSLK